MKSFFSKLSGLLLCGVMFIAVGCHDYAEDIQQTNDRIDAIDKVLDGSSDGVAKDLAALKAELATLKAEVAANTVLTAKIEGILADLAEVEASLGTLQTTLDGKADASAVTELQTNLEGQIAELAGDMDKVEANLETLNGLEAKLTAAFNEAVGQINEKISNLEGDVEGLTTDVANLETNLGVLKGRVDELEGTVDGLTTGLGELKTAVEKNTNAIKDLQEDLATEVGKLEAELAKKANQTDVDSAIAELNTAIDKKASTDSLNAAVNNLQSLIDELDEEVAGELETAIEGVKTDFAEDLKTLKEELAADIEAIATDVEALLGRVVVTEAQIKQLFNRIQSVVFRPKFADHNAHVVYATAGQTAQVLLEGYNFITYKVYPAACAETIANAINSKEEKLLDVTFDAINVKSAGSEVLEIISAKADEDGCLTICYKPELGEDFYAGSVKYSAALVLKEARAENPQNFSTEYTHFIPEANPKNWTIAAYVDDAAYDSAAEYANVEIPYVAYGKKFNTEILPGVAPRFVCGTEVLTAEEFAALGYNAEYTMVTTSAYPTEEPEQTIAVSIDNTSSVALACLVKLGKDYIADNAKVTKTLTWALTEEAVEANATVTVVDFDYQLSMGNTKTSAYHIPYTDKDSTVVAELTNFDLKFVNKNDATDVLTIEEVTAKYPAIDVVSSYALYYQSELFNYEEETYPTEVSLKAEVVAGDVSKKVRIRYYFESELLEENVGGLYADVIIHPQTYHFYTIPTTYYWNYFAHASVDAAIYNNTSSKPYEFNGFVEFDTKQSPVVQDDVKLANMLADLKYEVKDGEKVVDPAMYKIYFTASAADQEKPENLKESKVLFSGLAWDKKYNVTGRGEILTDKLDVDGNPIPGAIVYVHWDINTVDRNRDKVAFVAKPIDVTYALNVEGKINKEAIDFSSVYDILVANKNLDVPSDRKHLDDQKSGYLKDARVEHTSVIFGKDNEYNVNVTDKKEWSMLPDFSAATYDVSYKADNDFIHVDDVVAKQFHYETILYTWYGQQINLIQPINLVDPKYDFSPVYQYHDFDQANNCYFTTVQPNYAPSKSNFTDFSVNDVELNAVFDVVDGSNNKLTVDQLKKIGLWRTFALDKEYKGITTHTTADVNSVNDLISYYGREDYVVANGALYIQTTTGQKYTIDETIFNNDFKNFQVRKFDPISDMVILTGKENQTIKIDEDKEYVFDILKNYSLKDVLGNEIIGASKDYASIYDVKYTYTIKFIQPETAPTGIVADSINGKITIDNRNQVVFERPVIVEVSATADYPQNVKVGKTITYTFTK